MKEKIFIARNSEPEGSPSEYLGAEVSIGKLSSEMIDELKLLLENDNLFEEMAGNFGQTYIGSSYLIDLMDINEEFHKNGLIYYEDIEESGDTYSYSTKNWAFVLPEDENFEPNPDFKPAKKIELSSNGFEVISVRTMDLYFKAKGKLVKEIKTDFDHVDYTNEPKFKIQTGIANFHSVMYSCGFCGFNLLHSVYVNGNELIRDEDAEEEAGNLYYSSHLLFKDGSLIGWLASNNYSHSFPFDYIESEIPCISPYLKDNDSEVYQSAIKDLIDKIQG